jgi:hypothetical protein
MTTYRFVEHLPDLITPEEYPDDPDGRRLRFRIRVTGDGIEVLGDPMRPNVLEATLEHPGHEAIEQMLCG